MMLAALSAAEVAAGPVSSAGPVKPPAIASIPIQNASDAGEQVRSMTNYRAPIPEAHASRLSSGKNSETGSGGGLASVNVASGDDGALMAAVEAELSSGMMVIQVLESVLSETQRSTNGLEDALQGLQDEKEEDRKKMKQCERLVEGVRRELAHERAEHKETREELDGANARIEELEGKLKVVCAALEKEMKEREEAREELEARSGKVQKLERKVEELQSEQERDEIASGVMQAIQELDIKIGELNQEALVAMNEEEDVATVTSINKEVKDLLNKRKHLLITLKNQKKVPKTMAERVQVRKTHDDFHTSSSGPSNGNGVLRKTKSVPNRERMLNGDVDSFKAPNRIAERGQGVAVRSSARADEMMNKEPPRWVR